MRTSSTRHRATRLASGLTLAVAGVLALVPAAVAQDTDASASPSPAVDDGAATSADVGELMALLPDSVGSVELDPTMVSAMTGSQLLDANPSATAQYEAAAEATGVAVSAMTQINAPYVSDEQVVTVGVIRFPGAEGVAGMSAIIPVALEDMPSGAITEEREMAGRSVTVITGGSDAGMTDIVLYPEADRLWIVFSEDAALVEEALSKLPE